MDDRRRDRYGRIYRQLRELIEDKSPTIGAALVTICAVLHAKMPHHSWTGFYFVVDDDELCIGPYQGPVACQVLKGQGTCLQAAVTAAPVVVPDVRTFPGHIACDPRTRSEIVVPVLQDDGVIAVLDIDSNELAQFSEEDVGPLKRILSLLDPFL